MKRFFSKLLHKWSPIRRESSARKAIHDILAEPEDEAPTLDIEERLLMKNILQLRDEAIEDIMIPRVDIIAIPQEMDIEALISFIAKEPYTRLVVYGKNLDDLRGFIHVKDVMEVFKNPALSLKDIIQKPLIVVSSLPVLDLLVMMRDSRIPLAIVVDEFGGVDGLATAWDITKEIFGDMENPPVADAAPLLIPLKDGTFEADARLPLEEFAKIFNITLQKHLEEDDIDTLGGLIASIAGRVPARKELIPHPQGLEFVILEANPRRIERVKIIPHVKSS